MDFSQTAERISLKIKQKGQSVDSKKIEAKLRRLVEEFGVQPAEAERSVTNELAKEFNLTGIGIMGGGGGGGAGTKEDRSIADIFPGEWVTIEGKVVSILSPPSPAIAQSGIIADATGAIRFVAWAKANAPKMTDGAWYRIESAVVDEFKGVANLKIHSGTAIKPIEEDRALIPSMVRIGELKPGIASVRAKVVQEWETTHERMLQSGILGDESGTVKFVIWKEAGKEKLAIGAVYTIFYAQVDEYNGRLSLNLNTAMIMQDDGDIIVSASQISKINEQKLGIGCVQAKVILEWETSNEKKLNEQMLQSGLLGDDTGTIKFVMWKAPVLEGSGLQYRDETGTIKPMINVVPGRDKLVVGSVCNIFFAQINEFNGKLSLNLNNAIVLQDSGVPITIEGEAGIQGAIVHIAPGSGIIKRCPVEGCNRALSRQNYCPVHEIQPKFVYDLRIKGWLDDGQKTYNILLKRDVVESLTGITLDAAKEIAENNPLGMDEVFLRIRDLILGRYFICHGRAMDNLVLINKCEQLKFESGDHAALLNRAGGSV